MSDTPQGRIATQRIVYTVPGMEAVTIRRDETYRIKDGRALTFDVYYPPTARSDERSPAVLLVTGFSDTGAQRMFGCQFKEMGSYVSWAQLIAASGIVAITYSNDAPVEDVHAVLQHVRNRAMELRIDEERLGVWACSGNVPNALSVLQHTAPGLLKCAVLCYGYFLDLDGSTRVEEAARQFGFVNPCSGTALEKLPGTLPLFIARAGQDLMPGLNETLDRFVFRALTRNLPVTLVNLPAAPHGFDCSADNDSSRDAIRQMLMFMSSRLAS